MYENVYTLFLVNLCSVCYFNALRAAVPTVCPISNLLSGCSWKGRVLGKQPALEDSCSDAVRKIFVPLALFCAFNFVIQSQL